MTSCILAPGIKTRSIYDTSLIPPSITALSIITAASIMTLSIVIKNGALNRIHFTNMLCVVILHAIMLYVAAPFYKLLRSINDIRTCWACTKHLKFILRAKLIQGYLYQKTAKKTNIITDYICFFIYSVYFEYLLVYRYSDLLPTNTNE